MYEVNRDPPSETTLVSDILARTWTQARLDPNFDESIVGALENLASSKKLTYVNKIKDAVRGSGGAS